MFPTNEVAQTAAVMTALASSQGMTDAATIAATFRQGRRIEPKVAAVLDALNRMGFVVLLDRGWSFRTRH